MHCSPPLQIVAQRYRPIFHGVVLMLHNRFGSILRGNRCILHRTGSVLVEIFDRERFPPNLLPLPLLVPLRELDPRRPEFPPSNPPLEPRSFMRGDSISGRQIVTTSSNVT